MRIHVLGLGPIGSLVAHTLRKTLPQHAKITGIVRTLEKETLLAEKKYIRVEHRGAVSSADGIKPELFRRSPLIPPESSHYDSIQSLWVALKAHQTVPAIRQLAPRLSADSTIVLLQNGMGVYDELVQDVFQEPEERPHFILASNTHGAFLTSPYYVVHAGVGSIEFGIVPDYRGREFEAGFRAPNPEERRPRLSDISFDEDPEGTRYTTLRDTVAALLLMEPLNTSWKTYSEMQVILKRKLAVNAFVNPLTALLGCRNGYLLDMPPAQRILDQVCREAHTAFQAQTSVETKKWLSHLEASGVDTTNIPIPTYPRALTAQSLKDEIHRVLEITKSNMSSMLQDVQRGRTTEIDYINGYITRLAQEYGVRAPTNATLQDLIKMRCLTPLDRIL